MRSVLVWVDKAQERDDGQGECIRDLAFKPDGTELVVASGTRVLVYDAAEGTQLQSLKDIPWNNHLIGHKDLVYCVAYAHNGERFASGSADRSVIIWTSSYEGVLKYSHNDAMQCLRFNPTSSLLLSCAVTDFGLWSVDQKSVNKHKVSHRIVSCDWSRDGQQIALGMFNGTVSIRAKNGDEKHVIDRTDNIPVWTLAFNPNKSDDPNFENAITIGSWDQTLGFFNVEGNKVAPQIELDYDICSIDYFTLGEYMVCAGSNKKCTLHTHEGIRLGQLCEQDSWIWTCKTRPQAQFVVVGCDDGTLACYQLVFSTVHGLHRDKYVYRDRMTDVIVQDLMTDRKLRIQCKDLVKKVAIYKKFVAVQVSDRILIFTISAQDSELTFKLRESINQNLECSLLVICSKSVILCQERRLQCYNFHGLKEKEWHMDALIRYIKAVGGPPGQEALLLGLKNGKVLKIFIDNPFPVELLRVRSAIRCLDVSLRGKKVAIVDEHSACLVYDLAKRNEPMYQEPNANSVAWNTQYEDLLCYSGNGQLGIKVKDYQVFHQDLQGFVVGFVGSKVFCLHLYTMTAINIPLSNQLYQYLERRLFTDAYEIACLGVPESDWSLIATESLNQLDLETAKKACIRIRDQRLLDVIYDIEGRRKRGENNRTLFFAEIQACQGALEEAARLFVEAGQTQRAVDMYTDLRMFDRAQALIAQSGTAASQRALLAKQAEWAATSNEPRVAAEMYINAGDYQRALMIITQHGWVDMLKQMISQLDRSEAEVLRQAADYFMKQKDFESAAEIFEKLAEVKQLAAMYVQARMWEKAFALVETMPELRLAVYVPYANWLAENDKFEEAQQAFHKAGRDEEAWYVLEQLTENAVSETRFNDAAYYYWMLGMQYLDRIEAEPENKEKYVAKFHECQHMANLYYAYDTVHKYTAEPFTSYQPDALLNISRYILNLVEHPQPKGISKVATLYTIAKQGRLLGAYKLSRYAFERLQQLHPPARFMQIIDLGTLAVRAKQFHDSEDLLPMCYMCSTTSQLLNPQAKNRCQHCGHPFVFSYISFEVLPLVEFAVDPGLTDAEAKDLIEAEPPLEEDEQAKREAFTKNVKSKDKTFSPVVLGRTALMSLHRTEVFICEWPAPLKYQYYRNLLPEIAITKCDSCQRVFHMDDFEMSVLQLGHCPFCHRKAANVDETALDDHADMQLF